MSDSEYKLTQYQIDVLVEHLDGINMQFSDAVNPNTFEGLFKLWLELHNLATFNKED